MVSFIAASNHLGFSAYSVGDSPFFPSLDFLIRRRRQSFISFGPPVAKECGFLGFPGFKRRCLGSPVVLFEKSSCSGSVRRCKSWEEEGDLVLEAEILEFMQKSYNPNVFPTKKEFIDAGRMDLVKAIAKQGGWLALGWDLDEEETGDGFQDSDLMPKEIDDDLVHDDARIFQQRLPLEGIEDEVSSSTTNFSYQDSFSDRSIEMETEEDTGIEGILIRLEKERSKYFGGGSRKKEHSGHVWKNEDKDDWRPKISSDSDTGLGRSSRSTSLSTSRDFLIDTRDRDNHDRSFSDSDERSSSLKPEMWKTWSIQRAGFSNTEFEAAEIVPSESRMGKVVDDMDDEMFTEEKVVNETQNITQELDSGDKEKEYNPIRSRLQNLEVELASVLHLLRSRTDADAVDLHKLLRFRDARGSFGRQIAINTRENIQPCEWWVMYELDTHNLRDVAIRVLSQTSTSSGCKRNRSTFSLVHTKMRNCLDANTVRKLIYVHYNMRLKNKYMRNDNDEEYVDPLNLINVVAKEDKENPFYEWVKSPKHVLDEQGGRPNAQISQIANQLGINVDAFVAS